MKCLSETYFPLPPAHAVKENIHFLVHLPTLSHQDLHSQWWNRESSGPGDGLYDQTRKESWKCGDVERREGIANSKTNRK